MEAENQGVKSQFLLRLAGLPVVHTAIGHATSAYGRVKQTNVVLEYTLSTVEKSVLYANEKAQPIIKKLELRISSADMLACKGLDKLEQTVPIIKEPAEKILQDTKSLYTNTVQSGLDRYNSLYSYGTDRIAAVKNYGTDKVTGIVNSDYAKLLTSSVDNALALTENCVNFYLPASEDEEKDGSKKPVLERMSYLSTVVHRRARKLAAMKLQELQQSAQATVSNINVNDRLQQIKALPENMYANAMWVWAELNTTPEPIPEGSKLTLQQQAWTTARHLTHTVNTTVSSAYAYTISTYSAVQKIPLENLPQQFIDQARTAISSRTAPIVHIVMDIPLFQWLHEVYTNQTSAQSTSRTEDQQ